MLNRWKNARLGLAAGSLLGMVVACACSGTSESNDEGTGGGGAADPACTMGTGGSTRQACVDPALLGAGGGGSDAGGGGGGGTCPTAEQARPYFAETEPNFLLVLGLTQQTPNEDGLCCYTVQHTFCH